MELRIATVEDLEQLKDMALKFAKTTEYKISEEVVEKVILDVLGSDPTTGIILIADGGMIAGVANRFIFGLHMQATELAWWVEPEHRANGLGKHLLDAFEYWAEHVANCKTITMVSLDEELGKFYEKQGYKLYERAYMKEI